MSCAELNLWLCHGVLPAVQCSCWAKHTAYSQSACCCHVLGGVAGLASIPDARSWWYSTLNALDTPALLRAPAAVVLGWLQPSCISCCCRCCCCQALQPLRCAALAPLLLPSRAATALLLLLCGMPQPTESASCCCGSLRALHLRRPCPPSPAPPAGPVPQSCAQCCACWAPAAHLQGAAQHSTAQHSA
jgi:hypothetical protein